MKKKKSKDFYKRLFYTVLCLALLFFIMNIYFAMALYSQCAAGGEVLMSPARIPSFIIVFFGGFFLLCFAGWYIAFKHSY